MTGSPPALHRVLCAVDVKKAARSCLAMASVLAEQFGAHLQGLYVAAPHRPSDNRLERVKRLIGEHGARERLEHLLAPFERALAVESFVTRGTTAEVILAHADVHRSDLIVCGISGRSRLGEGSRRMASAISRGAVSAVLTVPGESPACALRHLLLVLTDTDATEPALAWTTSLARRFDATVSIVRLERKPRRSWGGLGAPVRAPAGLREASRERQRSAAQERFAETVLDADVDLGEPLLPEHDALGIATLVERHAVDLVVVGLSHRDDRAEPAALLVDRLRRISAAPTLSMRAPRPTLRATTHRAA